MIYFYISPHGSPLEIVAPDEKIPDTSPAKFPAVIGHHVLAEIGA